MFCSRCVLPLLTLYLLVEEISAAVLPNRFRNKRVSLYTERSPFGYTNPIKAFIYELTHYFPQEADWLDQELFSRLPDQPDQSVGDAGDVSWDVDRHRSHSETFLDSTERLPLERQHQSQFQYQRKANEKK